jgi:[acyl-carrier-protein] S-malonyltransferase
LVEEVELAGERLNYKLVSGTGPEVGWISIKLPGKDLAVKTTKKPRQPKPAKVGPKDEEPLPVVLLFPGQGSQYVGMLKELKDNPKVKEMLDKSKDILGWDVLDVCLNGPESKLEETKYCQPAMFIGGLAGLEKLKSEKEDTVNRASIMAGFSLGEYTALCAAGCLSFEEGLKLVKLRGEAMQEAATSGKKVQKMLSVAGLTKDKVKECCERAQKKEEGGVCSISNELFETGFSCGGTEAAIKELQSLADSFGAMQTKVIKAGGAFHTAMMQPAQDKLEIALEAAEFKPPLHTVWMNVDAEPKRPGCDPAEIVANLKMQLVNSVKWSTLIAEIIKEDGDVVFYECGPMKQLKAMMKRIDQKYWKPMTNVEV